MLAKHIAHLDKTKYKPFVICSPDFPDLIQQYKDAGAEVFSISYPQYKTGNPLKLPKALCSIYKTAQKIKEIGKEINPDLIVTNTARAWLPGILSAKQLGIKLIWFIRDYTYPRVLFRLLLPVPDGITFVSERLKNYYASAKHASPKRGMPRIYSKWSAKIRIIYVGTDMYKRIKNLRNEDLKRVRGEFNIQNNDIVIGFVGRLVEWKGAKVLLKAAKLISNSEFLITNGNLKYLIIGSGKGQEGDIEEELRNFLKKHNLEDTVYLTGQRDDVPALLKVMDIFIHPSIEPEPFATTVVEAMQAGVAVIGNTIGGTPEIIKDGKNGLLVPPNDPEALAAALERLIWNGNLRNKLAEKGQKKAVSGYTEDIITEQVEELYEYVLRI